MKLKTTTHLVFFTKLKHTLGTKNQLQFELVVFKVTRLTPKLEILHSKKGWDTIGNIAVSKKGSFTTNKIC